MADHYRFGDLQNEIRGHRRVFSLNDLGDYMPQPQRDTSGRIVGVIERQIELTQAEALQILKPYISVRFLAQFKTVVPLALYLALFQVLFLRVDMQDSWLITGGLLAVIVGLMFFMDGLKLGLMPFGTLIGSHLPEKSPLPIVLFITLLLGVGVTFAEPAIGALQTAGQNVSPEQAPYLFALLNFWSLELVLVVGLSVGLAAVVGTLRFLYRWSLKPLIYAALAPLLLLTVYATTDSDLRSAIGLAWDCGAVTTGPVTVPLVLSLGIGIAAASGKGKSGLSGFGIVTLASLYPIIGVLLLTLFVASTTTPAEILEIARQAAAAAESGGQPWYERTPGVEIILGLRAILPLVLFLFVVLRFVVRVRLGNPREILLGIAFTIVGMCIFNLGLTYGLSKLGGSAGGLVPTAFMPVPGMPASPIYGYGVGLALALVFACCLGFGATVAEPALNALGITTETLTNGVFRKKTLIKSVSIGVAFGITLGIVKLIFDLPVAWLIIPGYLLAILLTALSSEEFVNIAWDSAGVTTGPITVPLVLAMGLGLGDAVNAVEGFGILCMASIGPIVTVLITGLWAQHQAKVQALLEGAGPASAIEEEAKSLL